MLRPVTPCAPKKLNTHPPTTDPTMPRIMSRKNPSPDLFTILLPINPASRPSTIHARIDIVSSPQNSGRKPLSEERARRKSSRQPRESLRKRDRQMPEATRFGYNPRAHEPRI